MATLPDAFYALATSQLTEHPSLARTWTTPQLDRKLALEIPATSENGFTVRVECETYGLYVYADAWHGAPFECGPITTTPEATAENCLAFVRTLLCEDSNLEVHSSSGRPYRWVLTYSTEHGTESERMGLLVYNYVGRKAPSANYFYK